MGAEIVKEDEMNPIHIQKIDHVVLRVTDIKRSIRFYCDILGCSEARISKNLYQYQAGASMIDLVPKDTGVKDTGLNSNKEFDNMDHFALTLAEFDEDTIVKYLEINGIQVERSGRRFGAEGFGPSIYFKDPDGNFVELKGPPENVS